MNLSLFDVSSELYMMKHPRKPFPVVKALTTKKKGEAPKCKTCKRFYDCTKSHGTMTRACDRYDLKKRRK